MTFSVFKKGGSKMKRTAFHKLLCLVLAACSLAFGAAAGDYPSKTVQFIVNKGPGGGSDTVTRMYAACMEKVLDAKTVVINRPGGDGVVGTNDVAKAAADGYTLFVSAPSEIAYAIVNGAGVQFKTDSFVYISGLNIRGSILAIRKDAPFRDFKEFVEYARANPKKVTIGTPGGTQMANVQAMARAIGAELTVINAGNGNQLFTQVAGGHIDVGFIGAQFYPKFQDEKCPVIAQTVAIREDGWADVPTVKEMGYDFEFDVRMFICAPAGTPDDVVKVLGDATKKMFDSGLITEMFIKSGEKPKYQSYEELNAYLDGFYPDTLKLMQDARDARK